MWILETDGDIFEGKRLWLRPGKRFLFGRTRTDGTAHEFAVSDKTISRSHLLVEVSEVGAKDAENPHSRSIVTITDQATKIGTTLNGQQIKNTKEEKTGHKLEKDVNVIVLGRYDKEFRISWKPVVFTFSYTSKEHRANPYQALYERLGPLDIKVLVDYETLHTTHVAARKRNTAKGLQALIDGKYIVENERYIDALVEAATSVEGPSSLELDFDGQFPNELDYLPPRGDEPTVRDGASYAPNPRRKGMFEGYTFVFYEQRQFNNLMAPITQGSGKALCHPVTAEKTEVSELVEYVRNVAGQKGLGELDDGGEGKGVVVVRFNPAKGDVSEWFAEFNQNVSLQLGQRLVEQNEFLDAILGADASVLRRALEDVDASGVRAPPPSFVSNNATQHPVSTNQTVPPPTAPEAQQSVAPPPDPAPTRARPRRGAFKFKGFEDDDDNFFSMPVSSAAASQFFGAPPSSAAPPEAESQGLFVSQNPNVAVEPARAKSPTPPPTIVKPSRKRIAPNDDPFIDSLAPTAAAAKRRKIAEESARRLRGDITPQPEAPPPSIKTEPKEEPESPQANNKKKKGLSKEDDAAIAQARQKAEEESVAANAKREALEVALDGIPISAMKYLAVVETMPIGRWRNDIERAARADESARWDERWNGRKNFKKFRRRGGDADGLPRARKVIVRLEEAKKRDYGLGDDYWLENSGRDKESQRKRKGKGTQEESQAARPASRSQVDTHDQGAEDAEEEENENMDVDEELALAATRISKSNSKQQASATSTTRSTRHSNNDPSTIPASSSDVEIISAPPLSRSTRSHPTNSSSTQTQTQTRTQTQTLSSKSRNTSAVPAKRAAPPASKSRQPVAKKGFFGRGKVGGGRSDDEDEDEEEEDDDDDDEGLGFKFRRRK